MMMKLPIKKVVEVDAKTLYIHMKTRDEFSCTLQDAEGNTIAEQEDYYAPSFMPEGGGDYLILKIDIETGQITNWEKPDVDEVMGWVNARNGEAND